MHRLIFKTVLLLISLGVVFSILHSVKTTSSDKLVAYKTHNLLAQAAEVNTIFFGTSATRHGIDPILFDSLMAGHGINTFSYNFAINGLPILGQQYHLEKLLQQDFPNLKTVIFELSYPINSTKSSRLATWRNIEVHDLKRFLHYCDYFWQQFGGRNRFYTIVPRLTLFLRNMTLAGKGERLYEAFSARQILPSPPGPNFRSGRYSGFRPSEKEKDPEFKSRNFAINPGEVDRFYHFLKESINRPERIKRRSQDPKMLEILEEVYNLCKERSVTLMFLLPPKPYHYRSLIATYQEGDIEADLIIMNSPGNFPELYKMKYWFDSGHLNWQGARLATKTLVDLILQQPSPPVREASN